MKSEMSKMPEEQRREFELHENSRWRTMCGLMDRAREALVSARFASYTIIPPSWQQDKSGLGVAGFKFERLLPKLQEKAEAEGFSWSENKLDLLWGAENRRKAKDANPPSGSDSDSDDSDESSDDEDDSDSDAESSDVQSKPLFYVDTNPTPINLNGSTPKVDKKQKKNKKNKETEAVSEDSGAATKSKKRASEEPAEQNFTKKSKSTPAEPAPVDFTAVEAQSQAEVEAGLKAKEKELQDQAQAEASKEERSKLSKSEKKRKRNSDGIQGIVESFKKKQKLELRKKEKAAEATASEELPGTGGKKSKKRKAESEGDGKSKKSRAED